MFKQIIKVLFLFLVVVGGVLFFGLGKAKATEPQSVVINEVMVGPTNNNTGEFVELYNPSNSQIDLSTWFISNSYTDKKDSLIKFIYPGLSGYLAGTNIQPHSYALILDSGYTGEYNDLINKFIDENTIILTTADAYLGYRGLNNSIDEVILFDPYNTIIDNIGWSNIASWNNYSYEKNSDSQWYKSLEQKGTPGFENSVLQIVPPKMPEYISPNDKQQFNYSSDVIFSWQDDEEDGVTYDYQISKDENFSTLITDSELDIGVYYWRISVKNVIYTIYTIPRSFQIIESVYSKNIIINEICPHPENSTDYEFIELYNSSNGNVDLSGWILDDTEGGSTPYTIPIGTIILPGEYKVFYRSETNIALNDSGGDTARLFNPNDELVFSTSYSEYASLGLAWARGPDGVWNWTDQPTASMTNIMHLSDGLGGSSDISDTNQPINSEPIEISTGDFQNYENYLVTVMGEVVETSGDTFYLDDGTGQVKIYIQKKTGISKPEMHKGDIFLITGVVNLYGTTWRILPRTISDIRLVEKKATVAKNVAKKKTVAVRKTLAAASAKNLVGKAKAASMENKNSDKSSLKADFLLQLVKLITSLSVIFMVLLVVKVFKMPKPKIIGDNFGEDEM